MVPVIRESWDESLASLLAYPVYDTTGLARKRMPVKCAMAYRGWQTTRQHGTSTGTPSAGSNTRQEDTPTEGGCDERQS
jgi:hypothetical protein